MLAVNPANEHPRQVGKLIPSRGGLPDPAIADRLLNLPMTRDLPMDPEGDFLRKTWKVCQALAARAQRRVILRTSPARACLAQ